MKFSWTTSLTNITIVLWQNNPGVTAIKGQTKPISSMCDDILYTIAEYSSQHDPATAHSSNNQSATNHCFKHINEQFYF